MADADTTTPPSPGNGGKPSPDTPPKLPENPGIATPRPDKSEDGVITDVPGQPKADPSQQPS